MGVSRKNSLSDLLLFSCSRSIYKHGQLFNVLNYRFDRPKATNVQKLDSVFH